MKTYIFHAFLTIFGLLAAQHASAQLYPVPLAQRIENAKAIIKGRVIAQKSYADSRDDVFTANLVQVEAILKGVAEEKVVVVTKGGHLDDRSVEYSHALWLTPGQEGYFFFIPSGIEPIDDHNYGYDNWITYSGPQGFVQMFNDPVSKAILARDPFNTYTDIQEQLVGVIETQSGEKAVSLTGERDYRSGVRYHFTDFSLSGNSVTFKIYANSLIGSKKLYQSGIVLGYNPLVFGSGLGTNGNLLLYDGGISAEAAYDLGLANQSGGKVKISLETVGSVSGLSSIDGNEALLAKGKLTFLNPFLDPQIVPDVAQSLALNKWYDPQTGQAYPFDTVVIDFDLRELAAPIITKITPDTVAAGIDQVIEITGINFGNYVDGVSSVKFTDASEGNVPVVFFQALNGDIQYWDPTMIRVVVPTAGRIHPDSLANDKMYAGTGKIQVCNDVSMCGTSLTDLFVKYATSNYWTVSGENPIDQSFPISLFGANDEHGFYVSFDAGFAADTAALSSFMRALNTWKCATGLNYTTDPAHPNLSATNTAVISYAPLGAGTIGETARTEYRCKDVGSNFYVQGYLGKWTLQFNTTTSWYKSQSEAGIIGTGSYDMQSVALHELGHAHLLRHVNQGDHVMWFDIAPQDIVRKLNTYDIEGGNWVMDLSGSSLVGTTCPELTKPMFSADTTGLPCSILLNSNELHLDDRVIKIYPNPTDGTLNISFDEPLGERFNLRVIDATGRNWISHSISGASAELMPLDVSALPKGLYILCIETVKGQSIFAKFIKL